MASRAYYNENNPENAAWLRELIAAGEIAPGDVDERSIVDVAANDLVGYTQCHFFAGIGGWSYGLRIAGWPDDRPVWTGSCPCQPFSAAGQQRGIHDERHLWPTWFDLIRIARPPVVFGEQVASAEVVGSQLEAAFVVAVRERQFARANKLARTLTRSHGFHYWRRWFDGVRADLESAEYAVWGRVLGAHSVGAPHIRQRLWFVGMADTEYAIGRSLSVDRTNGCDGAHVGREETYCVTGTRGEVCELADAERTGLEGLARHGDDGDQPGWDDERATGSVAETGRIGRLADASCGGQRIDGKSSGSVRHVDERSEDGGTCPSDGLWRAVDWLLCRDGKWRPVIASHVGVSDGLPAELVRGGDEGISDHEANQEGEEVNGKAGQANTYSVLPGVWRTTSAQEAQWNAGGSDALRQTSDLRTALHGASNAEGSVPVGEPQSVEGASTYQSVLRDVRVRSRTSRSSHRRGPYKQRAVELEDVMRVLPSSLSLAKLHGRWRDAQALQALCEAICSGRSVLVTPESAQEIWGRLSREDQDQIRVGLGYQWVARSFSPLSVGEEARRMRLHGYGNAINPYVAAAFIESAVDL